MVPWLSGLWPGTGDYTTGFPGSQVFGLSLNYTIGSPGPLAYGWQSVELFGLPKHMSQISSVNLLWYYLYISYCFCSFAKPWRIQSAWDLTVTRMESWAEAATRESRALYKQPVTDKGIGGRESSSLWGGQELSCVFFFPKHAYLQREFIKL